MPDTKPFDAEIQRLETIILFLGLELEKHQEMLQETKIARMEAIKGKVDS